MPDAMNEDDPRRIVQDGYDRVSYAYRADVPGDAVVQQYAEWLAPLVETVPAGRAVLDLGCGCGVPTAQLLMQHQYDVVGVDISPVQIARARTLVPTARFLCADMTAVQFEPARFDAVVCLYAIIHVPISAQLSLLQRIATWLRPGGKFLAIVGSRAWTGTESDWLDVPGGRMFWSQADEETYRDWFARCGLAVQWHRFVPEDSGGHTLIFATRGTTTPKPESRAPISFPSEPEA